MNYKYKVGDAVMWCGAWGSKPPKPARIIDRGEKNDEPVYDLDNGHWAYEYQLENIDEALRFKSALSMQPMQESV